jgi:hypothetical protein
MFKTIVAYILFICGFLVGLLSIYRASLKVPNLTIVKGKVIEKRISISYGKGRHYSLNFKLEGKHNEIAINLGTKPAVEHDSTIYKVDTGKTYVFYLDPTVLTQNSVNWGICKIDYNGQEIFKASNKLNLYGGAFVTILSLTLIVLLYKHNQKQNRNHLPSR